MAVAAEPRTRTGADDVGHGLRSALDKIRGMAWLTVALAGLVMIIGGAFATWKGMDAKDQVREKLVAQRITTPDDASIPSEIVDDAATAESMAEVIDKHAREATGGQTYAEIGRFIDENGNPTSNEDEAARNPNTGRPVENPVRNVAFQASTLQTSLYTSVMAFNVADLVIGLGIAFVALGLGCWAVGVPLVWTVTRKL